MNDKLFNHIDIQKTNTHVPKGDAADMVKECTAYETLIKATWWSRPAGSRHWQQRPHRLQRAGNRIRFPNANHQAYSINTRSKRQILC